MTVDLENTGHMRLERGAMQHWSDLAEFGAHVSPALRSVVAHVVAPGARVLVVGSSAMDLVTEVAEMAGHLTVLSRSIPDCAEYASALVNRTNVEVICGDLLNIEHQLDPFDAVLVLEDLARVPSLEDSTPSWEAVFTAVCETLAPQGRLVMAVENELGLHRITSLRSQYTDNDNAAWDVVATFDSSRPRTLSSLTEHLSRANLKQPQVGALLPTWEEHTLIAWQPESLSSTGTALLNALTMSSPAFRQLGADPTRVTRAAVLADRVVDLASGWLVVAGPNLPQYGVEILASSLDGGVEQYLDAGDAVRCGDRIVEIPQGASLFGEAALDACASGDAARFRKLVNAWWSDACERAVDGRLAAADADLRFDNLLRTDDGFIHVVGARATEPLELAAWRAIVDFVAVIRARGARHLWPSATDDRTMAATIGAMAAVPATDDLETLLGERKTQVGLPARDVGGLLAVIERLEEKNKALASRASWFESRLNQRERELRGRAQRQAAELALAGRQQEQLRKSAEDLRRSLTYRIGNVAMGPLKQAKQKFLG